MIMSARDKTSLKKTNLTDLTHNHPDKNKKTKVNSGKVSAFILNPETNMLRFEKEDRGRKDRNEEAG